jgi:curved DNA-binding protein CbpA
MSSYGRQPWDGSQRRGGNNNQSRAQQHHPRTPRFRGRKVEISVPSEACGFIVGKKGRNIKELQRMAEIDHISLCFKTSSVTVVGTEEGIRAAKRRIDQAVSLAANAAGYFPKAAMTCFRLDGSTMRKVKFEPRSSFDKDAFSFGGVCTQELDDHRQYFVIASDEVGQPESQPVPLESQKLDGIVAGFNPSIYSQFFDEIFKYNMDAIMEEKACIQIGVNFGKTFLSSVPPSSQNKGISMRELNNLEYGKNGIRPEFIRHFSPSKCDAVIDGLLGDYVPLSSEKFVVIHCVSQRAKKRYSIKLKTGNEDEGSDVNDGTVVSDKIRQISLAQTYFDVLGLDPRGQTNSREVDIAFQRIVQVVHPDNNTHPLAGEAMKVLKDARSTLENEESRVAYARLPLSRQCPKRGFEYSESGGKFRRMPDVKSFQSKSQKLGLLTVLDEASRSEFRTTVEIENDEAMDRDVLHKLQEAWDDRDGDRFQFPDGTKDWLIVDMIRYKDSEKFSNGTFILTSDKATQEHFGKSVDGINLSLQSVDVDDELAWIKSGDGNPEEHISRLVTFLSELQDEAAKVSALLG